MRAHRSLTHAALLGSALALAASGCAGETHRRGGTATPNAEPAPSPDPADVDDPSVPAGSLSRARVDAVLKKGPPWLLSHVEVEEVLRKGTFVGWRVVAMPAGWEGSGIKPGDVVTRVNGVGLEKPDDFFAAWTTVASAVEVRVAFERDGKSDEITMPIVGNPSPDTKLALEQEPSAPTPNAPAKGQPPGIGHETRVISSGEDAF